MSEIHDHLSSIRKQYTSKAIQKQDMLESPFDQFDKWLQEAMEAQVDNLSVMNLSTASKQGAPSSRIVLLRDYGPDGFVFYTNYNSRKGEQIDENPQAALNFWWPEVGRQVRIEGSVEKISAESSDKYFDSRPPESKLSAWASPQSAVIPNRQSLEDEVARLKSDDPIKRPAHWGGYIVKPFLFEFWQSRSNRLHDRFQFKLEGSNWVISRLAP